MLLQTTKKGSSLINEYMLKMQALAHALMTTGQYVDDDELIIYILGGLGSDYESIVVNLTSREFVFLSKVQFIL